MTLLSDVLDLLIILRVYFRKVLQVLRELFQREHCRSFADRNAGATVNAIGWVYIKLRGISKLRFVLAGMDAVHRTNVHALLVLRAVACYHISHNTRLLRIISTGGPEPGSQKRAYDRLHSAPYF